MDQFNFIFYQVHHKENYVSLAHPSYLHADVGIIQP